MITAGAFIFARRAAELIRVWDKIRAVGEMGKTLPVTIAGRDRGRPQCAAVVAALKREHQVLAGVHAHDLKRVLDGGCASDIKMDPALDPERVFDVLGDLGRQLDFFFMQILAGELRQGIQLLS